MATVTVLFNIPQFGVTMGNNIMSGATMTWPAIYTPVSALISAILNLERLIAVVYLELSAQNLIRCNRPKEKNTASPNKEGGSKYSMRGKDNKVIPSSSDKDGDYSDKGIELVHVEPISKDMTTVGADDIGLLDTEKSSEVK